MSQGELFLALRITKKAKRLSEGQGLANLGPEEVVGNVGGMQSEQQRRGLRVTCSPMLSRDPRTTRGWRIGGWAHHAHGRDAMPELVLPC